ncbi:MAG TPA: hypothetical protein VGI40_28265 [Pirellulaceae bacterium]|jgi:hypothetical protein
MIDNRDDECVPPEVESTLWLRTLLGRGTGVAEVRIYAGEHDGQLRADWRADVRRVAVLADARGIDPLPILHLCDWSQITDHAVAAAYSAVELLILRWDNATKGKPKKSRGMSVAQANKKAMEIAKADRKFVTQPVRVWAERIKCSVATVYKTRLWRETMKTTGRGRSRGPTPSAVSFTHKVEAAVGDGGKHSVLDELIEEHEKDFEPSPFDPTPGRRPRRVNKQF